MLKGKLGGNRQDFWTKLKHEKVGLITYAESEVDQIQDVDENASRTVPPGLTRLNNSSSRVEFELGRRDAGMQNWSLHGKSR